jgi:general secretion pathway protein A
MYCNYFGFREKPFTITPNPQFIFLSKNHREAFAHLLYGIDNHAGFIELTGEVGTGKTTVLRTLLNQLDPDSYRTALIFNPSLSAIELLRNINHEFGIPPQDSNNSGLLDALNRFLLKENAEGRTVVLVIDEAQNLDPQVLEQVRLISNLETEKDKLIQIVLAGQPELREKLKKSELRQLSQRITVRYHLCPMDFSDTVEYVEHRVEVAAGQRLDIFTPGALRRIFRYSGGLPRLINVVCDRAFLVAYTKGNREISARTAGAAIADVRRDESGHVFRRIAGYAGVAVVAVLAYLGLCGVFKGLTGGEHKAATTGAVATSTQAAPPSPADSLQTVRAGFSKLSEGESALAAYNAIAPLWGVPQLAEGGAAAVTGDPLGLAGQGELRLCRFSGSLAALLRMDCPAILELTLPAGEGRRYLAIVGEKKGRLSVAPMFPGLDSISVGELESLWSGRGYIPWKNIMNIPTVNRRGVKGDAIKNLRQLLMRAGALSGPLTDVYDEAAISAVKKFQTTQGIEPDGMVGSRTLLLLYRAGGVGSPPRLAKKGDS